MSSWSTVARTLHLNIALLASTHIHFDPFAQDHVLEYLSSRRKGQNLRHHNHLDPQVTRAQTKRQDDSEAIVLSHMHQEHAIHSFVSAGS